MYDKAQFAQARSELTQYWDSSKTQPLNPSSQYQESTSILLDRCRLAFELVVQTASLVRNSALFVGLPTCGERDQRRTDFYRKNGKRISLDLLATLEQCIQEEPTT